MALDALGGTEFEPYNYQDSLRRRLQQIGSIGQGEAERIKAQRDLNNMRARAAEMQKLASMNPVGQFNSVGGGGGGYSGPMPGGSVGAFINAIAGQESGGSYGARNPSSGAMGKYQIMPANIRGTGRGWDYEALGRDISEGQFMSNPNLQEQIAQYMLKKYYSQYGPQGAAAAWYGGPGVAQNWSRYTNPEGQYPSIANYVASIMRRMGR